MTGGELVVIASASGLIYAAVARANRKDPLRAGRGRRARGRGRGAGGGPRRSRRRGSLLVKFYNATGFTPVEGGTAAEAAAEFAGRHSGRAARALHTWSDRRWAQRATRRPEQTPRDKWRVVGQQTRRWAKARSEQARTGWKTRQRRGETPASPSAHTPTAPAPTSAPKPHPAPPPPASTDVKGTTSMSETTATPTPAPLTSSGEVAPPLDWAVVISRVANFVPEDDTALVAFMAGETAGVLGYAEALVQTRENCVNDVGLDPAAVSGITAYSEHMSDASQRLAEAHQQFMAVYGEVLNLAASGVKMPFQGRWFTGSAS